MNYQDTWYRGKVIAKGYRECSDRYLLINEFCSVLPSQFSVLDIGANQCYFGLRLTEDFPGCSVLAFEYSQFAKRAAHVKRADTTGRIKLLKKKVAVTDIEFMSTFAHFDVVLVLSLLHHVAGEFDRWIAALTNIGNNVIAELATNDCRARNPPAGYKIPSDAVLLGECGSHINRDVSRPLILLQKQHV